MMVPSLKVSCPWEPFWPLFEFGIRPRSVLPAPRFSYIHRTKKQWPSALARMKLRVSAYTLADDDLVL